MKNLIIDADPGIDDAIAIILALKSRLLRVRAVTAVTGNMLSDATARNALKVLELMGREDIPVAQGPLAPLRRAYPRDPFSHGDDGLANTDLPAPRTALDPRTAAQLIVDTARQYDGDVSIACLGPLTNLALALQLDPDLPRRVNAVYAIAGAFNFTPYAFTQATGDNPVSEWNVYVDPDAASVIFQAGFRLTAIGLDVTTHPEMNLSSEHFGRLIGSAAPEANFAVDVLDFVRHRGYQDYCALIDALVIAALEDDSILTTRDVLCTVETEGTATLGMTVADVRNHHAWRQLPTIRAAADVDFARYRDFVVDGLTALAPVGVRP